MQAVRNLLNRWFGNPSADCPRLTVSVRVSSPGRARSGHALVSPPSTYRYINGEQPGAEPYYDQVRDLDGSHWYVVNGHGHKTQA